MESEINSESLENSTILKKAVQLPVPTIKFKAGDQDSMIKGIKEEVEVALDKEGVELLSLRLTELRI